MYGCIHKGCLWYKLTRPLAIKFCPQLIGDAFSDNVSSLEIWSAYKLVCMRDYHFIYMYITFMRETFTSQILMGWMVGYEKDPPKKKVRFAKNVVELSSDTQKDRGVKNNKVVPRQELKESMAMPLNWQVLYKGIIEYRISMQSSNFTWFKINGFFFFFLFYFLKSK